MWSSIVCCAASFSCRCLNFHYAMKSPFSKQQVDPFLHWGYMLFMHIIFIHYESSQNAVHLHMYWFFLGASSLRSCLQSRKPPLLSQQVTCHQKTRMRRTRWSPLLRCRQQTMRTYLRGSGSSLYSVKERSLAFISMKVIRSLTLASLLFNPLAMSRCLEMYGKPMKLSLKG